MLATLKQVLYDYSWLQLASVKNHKGTTNLRLDLLPMDVIFEILARLNLRDLFTIRQVNKTLYIASKQPVLWKKLVWLYWTIQPYLPPVPPSVKYNAKNLTVRDIETIATRSLSLDTNWRSGKPRPYCHSQYQSYLRTNELFLLPGSHYMIQSAEDGNGNHCIILWTLDHPAFSDGRAVPVAIRWTGVKGYGLQARYMTVRGRSGIAISFLRKTHKDDKDKRPIPETLELDGNPDEEDEYMPLIYECTVLHVAFDDLNVLVNHRVQPGTPEFLKISQGFGDIFAVVGRTRSAHQLGMLSLGELRGEPFVAIIKHLDFVQFMNLNTRRQCVLRCPNSLNYLDSVHIMWNIKILPKQNQVLLVRRIQERTPELWTACVIETFDLPWDPYQQDATLIHGEENTVVGFNLVGVQLSEPYYEYPGNPSVGSSFARNHIPRRVSAYFRGSGGYVMFETFWPLKERSSDVDQQIGTVQSTSNSGVFPSVYYSMETIVHDDRVCIINRDFGGAVRVLPGSHRAIYYRVSQKYARTTTPKLSIVYAFQGGDKGRHISEHFLEPDMEEDRSIWPGQSAVQEMRERQEVEALLDEEQPWDPTRVAESAVAKLDTRGPEWEDVMASLSAAAWDETTGRLVATSGRNGMIHIWDFAYRRHEDTVDAAVHEYSSQMERTSMP